MRTKISPPSSSLAPRSHSLARRTQRTKEHKIYTCRMWGSGKTLKVRTLGCARSSFPPTDLRPSSLRSSGRTRNSERRGIYTSSGHHCGVIPYSSVWWWIASLADEEQYKGKNSLLRLRCSCALWTCGREFDPVPPPFFLPYRGG